MVFGDGTLLWCLFKCSHSLGKFRAPSYVCLLCATQTAIPCGVVEDSCSYSWCSCCCRCFPLQLLVPLVECNLVFNLIAQLQIEFQFPLLNLCRQTKNPETSNNPKNPMHPTNPFHGIQRYQVLACYGMGWQPTTIIIMKRSSSIQCDAIRFAVFFVASNLFVCGLFSLSLSDCNSVCLEFLYLGQIARRLPLLLGGICNYF